MSNSKLSHDQNKSTFNERRRGADWVSKMATILSMLSWIIAIAVVVLLDQASPEKENMFTRLFNVSVRSYWDKRILPIAFILLILSLCSCIFAFFFNMLRMRRKTDKYKKSIIVIGVISIIGIVLFIIRFGV